ncbi:MAG TPA: GlsB/YeaQ/YmgE family stress response membrane protein [Thiothrix sp.]|nr:GlsB/YeaQ/YmgE family stress response membrane protein [Thiothrix sp.]
MDAANVSELISLLAIGAIAGWLAGILLKGRGFGLIGNIIVGVIGAVIGVFTSGLLASVITLPFSALINTIIWSTVGAVILLFVIGLFKK